MADFKIAIVGLGVTGTSLGLALKGASSELCIVGHDREPSAAAAARKAGAVDSTDWNLPSACRGANLVILALPLGAIRDTLAAIGPDLAPGCLVTDTAPVKAPVLAWTREALPAGVDFVGGDPIGARGLSGAPARDRFVGTTYCLCPSAATRPEAVQRASDLAQAVGAVPHFLDAAEHDGLVAALDQLPFLLSAALLRAAGSGPAWRELAGLGGGRFEHLLGALGDSPAVALDLAVANRENAGRWLERAQEALDGLKALLGAGDEARAQAVEALLASRAEWERRGGEERQPLPDVGFGLRKLFWTGK